MWNQRYIILFLIIPILAAPQARADDTGWWVKVKGWFSRVRYPDEEFKRFDSRVESRLLKIRNLIGRDKKCVLAIFSNRATYFTTDLAKLSDEMVMLPKTISCIQDLTVGKSTLDEKSGCALVAYDLKSGEYTDYFNRYFPNPMVSEKCNNGGFEKLMKTIGSWGYLPVEELLFSSYAKTPWRSVLVYAESPNYVTWFVEARKRLSPSSK